MGIEFADGGVLLLEIAQDHQMIHAAVASERLRYGVIVMVGLAVLWLALLPLLRAASRRLRDQAGHLGELLAKEQQTTTELRRLDDMKNAFLTSVSHELRTPLTLMRGSTEILVSRGDDLDPDRREQLYGMLQRHTDRLTRLVDDLVDLDRLRTRSTRGGRSSTCRRWSATRSRGWTRRGATCGSRADPRPPRPTRRWSHRSWRTSSATP
jgi:signal transduction histidine kinase